MTCAEERHKLVTASLNFYKTAEQVCSVLDSLEREYRRDEDWCGSTVALSVPSSASSTGILIAATAAISITNDGDETSHTQNLDKASQV